MSMFDVSVGCRVSVDPSRPNGIISISPLGPGYGIVGSEQIVGQPLNIPAISSIFPAEIHIGGNRRWRIDPYYVPPSPIVSWTKYSRTRVVGDRMSVVSGKSVLVRVDLDGRRIIIKKIHEHATI